MPATTRTIARGALTLAAALILALPAAAQVVVVADAGEDLDLECATAEGTSVTLDGLGSMVDGILASIAPDTTILWEAPGVEFDDETSLTPTGDFPLGLNTAVLTVTHTDPQTLVETSEQDTVDIAIGDTTPPTVVGFADPMILWPPNHRMEEIEVDLVVMDLCDPNPQVLLSSVVSSEPDNGTGDGDTVNDIQEADVGTDDRMFLLRAERSGRGSGRIYAATYEATDASGNSTSGIVEILVPHDKGDLKAAKKLEKAAKKAAKTGETVAKKQSKGDAKASKGAAKAAKKAAKDALKAAKAAEKAAKASLKGS